MYNHQLKILVCVADCGSFAKASEKLFISPTAIMKQINALEERLALKLLERIPQGVSLTKAGQSIYHDAEYLFEFSQEAINRAHKIAGTGKTTFRVGTSMLNPCKAFIELWQDMSDEFPQYALRIIPFEDDRTKILSEVEFLGKKFDFLIGACDSKLWKKRCNFYKIGEYRICCAVPKKHPLAKQNLLTVEQLYGECIMLGTKGDSPAVDAVRKELEKHPQINIEDVSCFYDIEVFNECEHKNNILLTLECWNDIHPSFVTIPVNWQFTVPYGIMYPLNPNHAIENFVKKLAQKLHE